MAEGNLRVSGAHGVGGQGAYQALMAGHVSANSTASGDYTEKRNVGGQDVYLTKGGAAALDTMARDAGGGTIFDLVVETHPGAIADWLKGNHDAAASIGKK